MNETKQLPKEQSKQTVMGIYLNFLFNGIFLFYIIYLYVVYSQANNVVGLSFLGIKFSVDIYAFIFLVLPVFIILSVYFNLRLLKNHHEQQGKAILFSFLSGSLIGCLLLWMGRTKLPPVQIKVVKRQHQPMRTTSQMNMNPIHQQPIGFYQQPMSPKERIYQKYIVLNQEGLITDSELKELEELLRTIHPTHFNH